MTPNNIRNFAIISHIDHGKSTLADRMLEITNTIEPRKMRERFTDTLELEQEHGVTIKMQAMRMEYTYQGQNYTLNLIDTPGHVDFGYEVSRALAACEGALLLVDASQGIQAQTLSNAHKAQEAGLNLLPVVNKIDLKSADVDRTKSQFVEMFGFETEEILCVSGKTGEGVPQLLDEVIQRVPAPSGDTSKPLRALVFDSIYSPHRGVVAYVRIVEGGLKAGEKIELMRGGIRGKPIEIGVIHGEFEKVSKLSAGEVGYIATGFKEIGRCQVGDTVTVAHNPAISPLPGYKKVKPVVFASLFPVDSNDYKEFREALEKLALNDSSLVYTPENSPAIGFGFRVGFLGTFHAEIIRERFEREFNLNLIITVPTVEYKVELGNGELLAITSPADFPEASSIINTTEPWVRVSVLSPPEYVSPLTQLIKRYRGEVVSVDNLKSQMSLVGELPLAEIITNFHDDLKSVSSGYASFDYELIEHKEVDLIKLDILVNYETVTPFTRLVVREKAESTGRKIVESLREVLPRQQFAVPIQAAVGGKIIARETLPPYRKDVTAKLYGGDRTRKDKLLKKQAKGKKKRAQFGKVNIPKEAFLKVLKS